MPIFQFLCILKIKHLKRYYVSNFGLSLSTFEGIISTAGEGRCTSLSETVDMWLPLSWGTNPGKHWARSDGARILALSEVSQEIT